MKNIFIGFILIFLDFNLNLGNSHIGLIPDFVGYFVMINGLVEMSEKSPMFMDAKPYATGMTVFTAILYLIDVVGFSVSLGALSYVLAITSTIVSLYISYKIVMGVIDMERIYSIILNGENLKSKWTILAVLNILVFVSLLIPAFAIVCIILAVIAAICFLVAFNNSKNLYYDTLENNID
ncbi:hypothetical protein CLNEO_24700 [Anaerotignum neopropionicum]|uniref:Acid-resistance membrane protein n=1 Tax=Anaerotignum neopropionicum TaxID=36847 RepID=A0A136WC78_9FIRM|nr:hypothetical protein [Anaerotignum neopropionicum]KXL52121.1 hypothetical protein CLNEO_24700 [Anaerotignum neopropionicum]